MQRTLRKFFPLFVLPTLIAFVIVFLIPFLMGIYLSFTEFTTVTDSQWVGLKNYITAFTANKDAALDCGVCQRAVVHGEIRGGQRGIHQHTWLCHGFAAHSAASAAPTCSARCCSLPNLIGGIVLGWIWQMIFKRHPLPL